MHFVGLCDWKKTVAVKEEYYKMYRVSNCNSCLRRFKEEEGYFRTPWAPVVVGFSYELDHPGHCRDCGIFLM